MPQWVDYRPHLLTSICSSEPSPSSSCLRLEVNSPGNTEQKRPTTLVHFGSKLPLQERLYFLPGSLKLNPGGLAEKWRTLTYQQRQSCMLEHSRFSKTIGKCFSKALIKKKTDSKETYTETGSRSYARTGNYFKRKDEKHREKRRTSEGNGKVLGWTRERKGGYFRIFRVEVLLEKDLGKDHFDVSDAVVEAAAAALGCGTEMLPRTALSVVRKSFDARKDPKFVYTVELDVEECSKARPESKSFLSKLRDKPAKLEYSKTQWAPLDLISRLAGSRASESNILVEAGVGPSRDGCLDASNTEEAGPPRSSSIGCERGAGRPKVVIVGSGPAGLFAALVMAETGAEVTVVERGQPVEGRGSDIGALMVRRLLNPESNLCYGEGGAGTWSDGKLTTRIGKNGGSVQTVLATLVRFGGPAKILMDGKPHLGTDRLVHILRAFRQHLHSLGATIMFGTRMEDLVVREGHIVGVQVCSVKNTNEQQSPITLDADAVVLGVGHSARDVYDCLLSHNVRMTAKDFAVGYRVEHPQELINEMQYHKWASEVQRGKGKVPVADYKVAANIDLGDLDQPSPSKEGLSRGCYSFCMCPGGQIVPTSTDETELCINGMSFSKRSSKWANAALVVTVPSSDFAHLVADHGSLAGIAFQRTIERQAALLGGGKLVVPAQTVPDFLDDRLSGHELPSTSYRLGVHAAPLHELLPSHLTNALKQALLSFDSQAGNAVLIHEKQFLHKPLVATLTNRVDQPADRYQSLLISALPCIVQLPGFIGQRALLHGVETRTSSPVRIERNKDTFESISLPGLFPVGEGAGYAGGIVSAAVDGMHAGFALVKQFNADNTFLQSLPEEL